jgi:hypothetical protein
VSIISLGVAGGQWRVVQTSYDTHMGDWDGGRG